MNLNKISRRNFLCAVGLTTADIANRHFTDIITTS